MNYSHLEQFRHLGFAELWLFINIYFGQTGFLDPEHGCIHQNKNFGVNDKRIIFWRPFWLPNFGQIGFFDPSKHGYRHQNYNPEVKIHSVLVGILATILKKKEGKTLPGGPIFWKLFYLFLMPNRTKTVENSFVAILVWVSHFLYIFSTSYDRSIDAIDIFAVNSSNLSEIEPSFSSLFLSNYLEAVSLQISLQWLFLVHSKGTHEIPDYCNRAYRSGSIDFVPNIYLVITLRLHSGYEYIIYQPDDFICNI